MFAEAAKRGEVDSSLVNVDSTTAPRLTTTPLGMYLGEDVITVTERACAEEEKARKKGQFRGTKRARRRD